MTQCASSAKKTYGGIVKMEKKGKKLCPLRRMKCFEDACAWWTETGELDPVFHCAMVGIPAGLEDVRLEICALGTEIYNLKEDLVKSKK